MFLCSMHILNRGIMISLALIYLLYMLSVLLHTLFFLPSYPLNMIRYDKLETDVIYKFT